MYCAGLGLGGSGRERPGPWLPQAIRASARLLGAAGVCAYPAQAPPSGGNGGGAAASGSAAGDDLYGAGLGVPAPPATNNRMPRSINCRSKCKSIDGSLPRMLH